MRPDLAHLRATLATRGWVRVPEDPATLAWARAALPLAEAALEDPAQAAQWQCEGTWFVGVDALENDAAGAVAGVALEGPGPDLARALFGDLPLHRAQVSAVRPGYPRPRAGESEAAFRYRARRDAAHVDGLLPVGPERRRMLVEPHAWILGLPLTESPEIAAPLVVWDGSHKLMSAAFAKRFSDVPSEDWGRVDLTEIYQATRRAVFETCPRIPLSARPGEALLLHRHLLHGIAPWAEDTAQPGLPSRIVTYFRPQFETLAPWLGD